MELIYSTFRMFKRFINNKQVVKKVSTKIAKPVIVTAVTYPIQGFFIGRILTRLIPFIW